MLKHKFIITEYLYVCYFLLQALLPDKFNFLSTLVGFALISLANWQIDGLRIVYVTAVLLQFLLLIIPFTLIRLPLALFMLVAIQYFPFYKRPAPTGQYLVGYKLLSIDGPKGPTSMGVYYPTLERTQDVKYAPTKEAFNRLYDVIKFFAEVKKKPAAPKWLLKLMLNSLERQHLGVNKDARIIKLEGQQKTFPVILFSHGLAANIHIYSCMLKEWASQGFIVFSMDHEELIYIASLEDCSYQEQLPARNAQLDVRKKTLTKAMDLVYNPAFLTKIFEDSEVKANYNKVFLAGHSFGGATAAEVAAEDKRATGGLVILDPWLEATNENVLYKPINLPILSLRTVEFDVRANIRERVVKHVEANKKGNVNVLSGIFKESRHNSMMDHMLMLPRELVLRKEFKRVEQIEEQVISHWYLSRVFLMTALGYDGGAKSGQKQGENVATLALERYREEIKKIGKEDTLIVDK